MKKKGDDLDNVTMGTVGSRFHLPNVKSNRKIMILALAVIVALVGVGVYLYYSSGDKVTQKQEFEEMMKLEEKAHSRGQDDKAKKLLEDFMDKYPHNRDKAQRYKIANAMIAIYKAKGDYKNAQKWQLKSFDESPMRSFKDYFNLAETCRRNNDKTCAKDNYQKSLEAIEHGEKPPGTESFKTYINAQLKAL